MSKGGGYAEIRMLIDALHSAIDDLEKLRGPNLPLTADIRDIHRALHDAAALREKQRLAQAGVPVLLGGQGR